MSTRPHRSCREKSKKWFQGDSGEEEDEEEKVDPKEEVPSQNIEGKDINHDQEESQKDTTRKVTKQSKGKLQSDEEPTMSLKKTMQFSSTQKKK